MDRVQRVDTSGVLVPQSYNGGAASIQGIIITGWSRMPRFSLLQWTVSSHRVTFNGNETSLPPYDGEYMVFDAAGNWLLLEFDQSAATVDNTIQFDYVLPVYDPAEDMGFGDPPLSSLVFEDIARRVYRDPELGILLRQLNILDTGVGGQYLVPKKSEISKEPLAPESHICKALPDLLPFYDERMNSE